ncbi:MAG: tetratricopeptide repeat protein, partial [Bacteroidota bacterium]
MTEIDGQANKNQSNRRKIEGMIREHQYKKALSHTRQLLDTFPRDPHYNYYQGICLVELKESPEKAIYHLKYASVKSVPSNVHIYLGRAYHYNYQFQEALAAYERFGLETGWRERRKYQIEYYRSQTEEAISQTRQASQIKALVKEKITTNNPVIHLKKKTGMHFSLPADLAFIAPKDRNYILQTKDAPFIIYAAQNNRQDNKDLYILYPNSSPTPLPDIINSSRDEHYPYYNFKTNTLYFASKGHKNMG